MASSKTVHMRRKACADLSGLLATMIRKAGPYSHPPWPVAPPPPYAWSCPTLRRTPQLPSWPTPHRVNFHRLIPLLSSRPTLAILALILTTFVEVTFKKAPYKATLFR